MAISDYDTIADNNGTISGIDIAEGCDAGNINNGMRQQMADAKVEQNRINDDIAPNIVRAAPYTTYATQTAVIPVDGTIPTSIEGIQILSASITPRDAANKIVVRINFNGAPSGVDRYIICTAFKTGSTDAFAASTFFSTGNILGHGVLETEFVGGGTSAITVSARLGISSTGTFHTNGGPSGSGGDFFGGILAMTMQLEELVV